MLSLPCNHPRTAECRPADAKGGKLGKSCWKTGLPSEVSMARVANEKFGTDVAKGIAGTLRVSICASSPL